MANSSVRCNKKDIPQDAEINRRQKPFQKAKHKKCHFCYYTAILDQFFLSLFHLKTKKILVIWKNQGTSRNINLKLVKNN